MRVFAEFSSSPTLGWISSHSHPFMMRTREPALALRGAALALFCSATRASASHGVNCTGRPMLAADLRSMWSSPNYDRLSRPAMQEWKVQVEAEQPGSAQAPSRAPPDEVFFNFQLNSLPVVDSRRQRLEADVWLRIIWWDYRLAYDGSCMDVRSGGTVFPGTLMNELWHPSIFSRAVADSRPSQDDQSVFWLSETGQVWWLRKLYLVFSCPMQFTDMPFDTQRCRITFSDFLYSSDELRIRFADDRTDFWGLGPVSTPCLDPATAGGTVEWMVTSLNGSYTSASGQSLQSVSNVNIDLEATRVSEYWMGYVITPIICVVFITWSSFFISRTAVPARVAMVIIAFLTLSGIINNVLSALPRLPGSVWLLQFGQISQHFVFFACVEYPIANFVGRLEKRVNEVVKEAKRGPPAPPWPPPRSPGEARGEAIGGAPDPAVSLEIRLNQAKVGLGPLTRLMFTREGSRFGDQHLDIVARYCYPVAYCIFLGAWFSYVPTQPGQDPSLTASC